MQLKKRSELVVRLAYPSKFFTSKFPARPGGDLCENRCHDSGSAGFRPGCLADMYPYVAGGTALAASLPPWMADGACPSCLTTT